MSGGSAPPLPAEISGSSQAQNDLYDAALRARMSIPLIHETPGTPAYPPTCDISTFGACALTRERSSE